jgi:hypothetical protein
LRHQGAGLAGHLAEDRAAEAAVGKVLAQALRQPLLAEPLGLVRPLELDHSDLPDDLLAGGGWVYVTLPAGSSLSALLGVSGAVRLYAARVPALPAPRRLFTPVLFPVAALPPPGVSYDTLFREAIAYDDGFAKAVYARQPIQVDPLGEADDERPNRDLGIQLGWDDEQVVTWLNRQIDPAAALQDAPMGVLGYRVDGRLPAGDWQSLVLGETAVAPGGVALGSVTAEFRVEIAPSRLFGDTGPDWWIPSYYTAWTGPSLAAPDPIAHQLGGGDAAAGTVVGVPPALALRYGEAYEFRVRLVDLAGGGPDLDAEPRNAAPHPSAPLRFLRWVRPGPPRLATKVPAEPVPEAPPTALVVHRPLLSYPAAIFAGGTVADLLADLPTAEAERRAPGLPDLDAALLEIEVQVETPGAGNADGFLTLHTVTRAFPAIPGDPLTLTFDWQDVHDAPGAAGEQHGPVAPADLAPRAPRDGGPLSRPLRLFRRGRRPALPTGTGAPAQGRR